MTASRIIVANGTYGITRRTMFRKLFWTPSDPVVQQGYLYALAEAQQRYRVELHHNTLIPSHEHLTVTPRESNLPMFFRHLHRESSRFLQEYMLAHGYDAPANVWDSRPTHALRLLGAGAQAAWALYSHLNCVAAGLVERVEDYPGWTSDLGLLKGGIVAVKKPPFYCGKDRSDELPLTYTTSPMLARAFAGDLDGLVHWMRRTARDMEDAYRDERRERGERVLGAARVKAIHPFAEPRTPRERRGQLIPTFKIAGVAGMSPDDRELAKRCAAERRAFVRENRACYLQWRDGDREIEFPAGTYGMRVYHGAKVGPPGADAVLCVGDDLESVVPVATQERKQLMAAVVAEVRQEADASAEPLTDLADSTDNAQPARGDTEVRDIERPERAPAHALPLCTPALTAELEHASRVVTLRTRRERDPPPE